MSVLFTNLQRFLLGSYWDSGDCFKAPVPSTHITILEALLTDTLLSGQFYLRPPSEDPIFLNSVFLTSLSVMDTFFACRGCPLTRAFNVLNIFICLQHSLLHAPPLPPVSPSALVETWEPFHSWLQGKGSQTLLYNACHDTKVAGWFYWLKVYFTQSFGGKL